MSCVLKGDVLLTEQKMGELFNYVHPGNAACLVDNSLSQIFFFLRFSIRFGGRPWVNKQLIMFWCRSRNFILFILFINQPTK